MMKNVLSQFWLWYPAPIILAFVWALPGGGTAQQVYFPPKGAWEQRAPASLGINPGLLQDAIDYARSKESANPRNMEENHYRSFGREPYGEPVGPFADRGEQTGIIIYRGYVVAQWGEPARCDMAHSVTKSMLSAVVGMAMDKGLINNVHDRVAQYIPPVEIYTPGEVYRPSQQTDGPQMLQPFAGTHNGSITWDHLLRQTSSWRGTLWGKPDWADRPDRDPNKWPDTTRPVPGSVFEYNDVRVNALALAATMVWRKPLPQVLRDSLLDPIGASNTWRWAGYRNAWVVVDGQPVQSVSGGGHWGGGLFINAWDMARFGYLTLHHGKWKGKQLLSETFFRQALTPTPAKTDYGFMNYFLNTGRQYLPDAPATAWCHIGNGTNMIYVDPEHELVAVVRWFDPAAMNDIVKRILACLPH